MENIKIKKRFVALVGNRSFAEPGEPLKCVLIFGCFDFHWFNLHLN